MKRKLISKFPPWSSSLLPILASCDYRLTITVINYCKPNYSFSTNVFSVSILSQQCERKQDKCEQYRKNYKLEMTLQHTDFISFGYTSDGIARSYGISVANVLRNLFSIAHKRHTNFNSRSQCTGFCFPQMARICYLQLFLKWHNVSSWFSFILFVIFSDF